MFICPFCFEEYDDLDTEEQLECDYIREEGCCSFCDEDLIEKNEK